jgi:hypothetical protein
MFIMPEAEKWARAYGALAMVWYIMTEDAE